VTRHVAPTSGYALTLMALVALRADRSSSQRTWGRHAVRLRWRQWSPVRDPSLRHHQVECVVGKRAVLAPRHGHHRPCDARVSAGSADDDDSRDVVCEAERGDPGDLSTLEGENAVTGTGAVIAAARDNARCVEGACVRTRSRLDITCERELIADQGRLVEALPRRVVDEVETDLLLDEMKRDRS